MADNECPAVVRLAIRVLTNHIDPTWEPFNRNTVAVVKAWLDGTLELSPARKEDPARG